jgi:ketosteroid isomerase-like protein
MRMTGKSIRGRRVLIGRDIALVFGTADLRTANAAGQESESALRYTAAYVRREGSWRMLDLQMQQRANDSDSRSRHNRTFGSSRAL